MTGERDLNRLLANLKVTRRDGRWRFITGDRAEQPEAIMAFREAEGWTHIIPAPQADTPGYIWLEISVHSSLDAVGFLAELAARLAAANIPCNAVAGYYHDHIFVPEDKADAALIALT